MRTMVSDSAGSPSAATFRRLSAAFTLRHHQVASLEPSSEEEFHHLDLLHSRLANSLQALLPSANDSSDPKTPAASAGVNSSLSLSLPFLHKLIDSLLATESDFKSLLFLVRFRNPSLISRPPLDRAVSDLLDRAVKVLDLCNDVSLSLQSLRHWNRHAVIAAAALHRPAGLPSAPPQINRAQRSLSRLLFSASNGLGASSPTCSRMCRICLATRYLQAMASRLATPLDTPAGSTTVLSLALHTINYLLHFVMWVMVASFPCRGVMQPPPPLPAAARRMPWAAALSGLHEKILEELRRERKEAGAAAAAGFLAETLALERSGRVLMEMARDGKTTVVGAAELAVASQRLEEELGPFERKVRDLFHGLVRFREEVLRCLNDDSRSSAS